MVLLSRAAQSRPLWLLVGVLLLVGLSGEPGRAQEEPDWRFGVVEAYTAQNTARELNIGWTRVRYHWGEVQADGVDTWTPELSDEQIDAQLSAGREVVGLLIGIPDWARDEAGLPQGLWLAFDDPDNTWGVFVHDIAARYAGRIDHWIIWNEPDIADTEIAHSWDGNVDDFYQLQRVAYLAAKAANPDAIIHLPAFTYWADFDAGREQYMARLLDRILADPEAQAYHHYFDVATAHLYFQPDQVYNLLGNFRQIMRERGLNQPIWLVETNAPPYDDPAWPVTEPTLAVSGGEQAAFMPQSFAAALAAGAQRVSVYKLRDTEDDRAANPEPFGLLRVDGSRRLATNTLREAIRLMRGTMAAERERWDEVGQFRLEQEDRVTTVLFNRLPSPLQVEVEAIAPTARLVDMWGQEEVVEAEGGRYILDLQQALCTQTIGDYCMIGGTVLYLIQARDGEGLPQGDPPLLPEPTVTPTALPSPSPSPQPTSTATRLMPTASATARPSPNPTTVVQEDVATATRQALAGITEAAVNPTAARRASTTSVAAEKATGVQSYLLFGLAALLFTVLLLVWLLRRPR